MDDRQYFSLVTSLKGFPGSSVVKNPPANTGDEGSISELGRSDWRMKWQPAAVFLPGDSHGQRSLAGFSPWGHKRVGWDLATEHVHFPEAGGGVKAQMRGTLKKHNTRRKGEVSSFSRGHSGKGTE